MTAIEDGMNIEDWLGFWNFGTDMILLGKNQVSGLANNQTDSSVC